MGLYKKIMSWTEEKNTSVDTITKIVGVLILLPIGAFAFWQYLYAPERELKKAFIEKQMNVVADIYNVMNQIDSAKTDEEKISAANKFHLIRLGEARTFLTQKLFHDLKWPSEYIDQCVLKTKPAKDFAKCEEMSSAKVITGFASDARNEILSAWNKDLGAMANQDPISPLPRND